MTVTHVAQFLIEDASEARLGKRASVFINRMMLRFFSAPPVLVNLTGINLIPGERPDDLTVELEFHRLPNEVIPEVVKLVAAPCEVAQFRYIRDGTARTGFRFQISQDNLSADEYELST